MNREKWGTEMRKIDKGRGEVTEKVRGQRNRLGGQGVSGKKKDGERERVTKE